MLKLSKRIAARTKTLEIEHCKKDMFVYDASWRKIRGRSRNPMDTCYWCKHKFVDGEKMSLAFITGRTGNKVLCGSCADEALRESK